MSDLPSPDRDNGAGPLGRAALVGWLLQLIVLLAIAIVLREFIIEDIDDGHGYEADGSVRPSAMLVPGWLLEMSLVLGKLSLVTLAWPILLWLVMRWAERREAMPLGVWLAAGAGAGLPTALGLAILIEIEARPPPPLQDYLLWAAVPIVLGAFAAATARRIRHPARWLT